LSSEFPRLSFEIKKFVMQLVRFIALCPILLKINTIKKTIYNSKNNKLRRLE
jgi:hypothetical protein